MITCGTVLYHIASKNIDASRIACSIAHSITVSRHPKYNHRVIVGMVVVTNSMYIKRSMTTDKVTRYCRLRLWNTAILIVYDGVLSEFDTCRKCVRKMTAWQDAFQCDAGNCWMHCACGTTYLQAGYLEITRNIWNEIPLDWTCDDCTVPETVLVQESRCLNGAWVCSVRKGSVEVTNIAIHSVARNVVCNWRYSCYMVPTLFP